jgi:hypothetical protein
MEEELRRMQFDEKRPNKGLNLVFPPKLKGTWDTFPT